MKIEMQKGGAHFVATPIFLRNFMPGLCLATAVLLAGTPSAWALTDVIDIDAGGGTSGSYVADVDYSGGWISSVASAINTSKVTNPAPQAVYQSQRVADSLYTIPHLTPNAAYTVRLHFAETYWSAAGDRLFNVKVNGTQVLTNFDIFQAAGGKDIAIVKEFTANASASGNLAVQFVTTHDNAAINGIQIQSGSASGGAIPYPSAGWLPFNKGPIVTTVASMYGSDPVHSCAIKNTTGGPGCLTANSAAIISTQWGNNPFNFGNANMTLGNSAYYISRYNSGGDGGGAFFQTSGGSDPLYTTTTSGCASWAKCQTGTLHIPVGAEPQLNTDHHLEIRDLTTNLDWGFWVAKTPSGTGGTIGTNGGTIHNQTYNPATSEGVGVAGTAGNISMLWSVRPQDILAGRIPHALSLVVTCDVSTDGNKSGAYVYPVVPGQDGGATDNNYYCGTSQVNNGTQTQWIPWSASNVNLEYGAHLWLDAAPSPSLRGTAGCDIIAFAYLRALNEFGAYVNDVGSAYWQNSPISVNLMSDISDTYSSNPHGTHSYWADVFSQVGLGTQSNTNVHYTPNLTKCGINLAQHLHVLIPPTPN